MAAKFTEEEDYHYLHKLAWEANGEEKKWRKELVDFRDRQQAEKIARKNVRDQKAKETAERVAQLKLILKKEEIPDLRGRDLKDHLKLFKNEGAPNLQQGALPTKAGDIRKALTDAIDLYNNGIWKIIQNNESETESIDISVEEDEEDEDEENWEDIEWHQNVWHFYHSSVFSRFFSCI